MTSNQLAQDPNRIYQEAQAVRANMEKKIGDLQKYIITAQRDTRPKTRAMEQRISMAQKQLDMHQRKYSSVVRDERIARSKTGSSMFAGFGGGLFGSGNRNAPPPSSPPSDRPRF